MKPVMFVGQAPGRSGDPSKPLAGYGKMLAPLCGISWKDFLRWRRVNLNRRWTGKRGKGDNFDPIEGSRRARAILSRPGPDCVLLGQAVSRCFGLAWSPLRVCAAPGRRFLLLPHPSGINQWWNRPENRRNAALALRNFLR